MCLSVQLLLVSVVWTPKIEQLSNIKPLKFSYTFTRSKSFLCRIEYEKWDRVFYILYKSSIHALCVFLCLAICLLRDFPAIFCDFAHLCSLVTLLVPGCSQFYALRHSVLCIQELGTSLFILHFDLNCQHTFLNLVTPFLCQSRIITLYWCCPVQYYYVYWYLIFVILKYGACIIHICVHGYLTKLYSCVTNKIH